jgi:hypothetical protein
MFGVNGALAVTKRPHDGRAIPARVAWEPLTRYALTAASGFEAVDEIWKSRLYEVLVLHDHNGMTHLSINGAYSPRRRGA